MNEKQGVKYEIYKNLKPFFLSFFQQKSIPFIFFCIFATASIKINNYKHKYY